MIPKAIVGVVLLVLGVVLLVVGMNASNSVADQVSNTFTGKFTNATAMYIFGGLAVGLIGLLMTIFGVRGKGT